MLAIDREIQSLQLKIHRIKGSGMLPEEAAAQHEHLSEQLSQLMQIRDRNDLGGYTDDKERIINHSENIWDHY